ncbi:hypothetical protein ACEPAF_8906 [Sanghuangporus sanghuang]
MSCTHEVDASNKECDESEFFWTCCDSCDRELHNFNNKQIAEDSADGVLENTFSHEALAHGIGKLKYPNDEKAGSEYSFDWADVLPEVENRMERILSELNNGDSPRPLGCRIGELFNEIGTAVRERLEIPQDRFSAEFTCQFAFHEHKLDSTGMNEGEKPELVLVEHHSLLPSVLLSWKHVKVPVVFFHGDEQTVLRKLLSSAIHIWSIQGYRRRFVMEVAFYEDYFELICFNPSGIIHSKNSCISDAMNLARLVLGLLFMSPEDLGYDPSVLFDEEHSTLVNQKKYSRKVVCGLTSHFNISATTCVIAERSGELYTIKDVWLDGEENDDGPFEVQILRRISDVENVPRLVDHERVKTRHGAEDSTNPFGKTDESFYLPTRFHHRYVMKPAGTHLDRFISLEEIVSAIRDIVKVIKDLLERRIVHGDISFYNIVLAPNAESPTSLRKGCVVDFVHAVDLDRGIESKVLVNPWFCPQYLAGAIYKGEYIPKRTFYQDLESTLYLLCFVCIALDGPDKPLDLEIFSKRAPLLKWDNAHSPESLYSAYLDRAEALESRWRFKERILAHFHPYFEDLKATTLKMYDLLFPDVLYDFGLRNVEENLKKLRESLKEVETVPDSDQGAEKKRETLRQIKDCEKRLAVKPLDRESPDELFAKMFAILDGTLDRLRQKSSSRAKDVSEISTEQSTGDRN